LTSDECRSRCGQVVLGNSSRIGHVIHNPIWKLVNEF
jgi:hypothetical protein